VKQTFTASVWQEGDWFVAQCLEVDVASQGETEEEALTNLKEALELHFEPPRVTAYLETRSTSVTALKGAAGSLKTQRRWKEIMQIAREDHIKQVTSRE
jgi:predicted RNase H-like HicB family nuclease